MARQRRDRSRRSGTYVEVKGDKVIFHISESDLDRALDCLEDNRRIEFTFGELRVREFPTDMIFEPKSTGSAQAATSFDGDGDGDGDGSDGGADID